MEYSNPSKELLEKYEKLKEYLVALGGVAIAFSGGVDSAFLLFAAREALGEQVVAITANTGSVPQRELDEAAKFCKDYGVRQEICQPDEQLTEVFLKNPPDRCYYCKRVILEQIRKMAEVLGFHEIVEGSNLDDSGDYRPGMKAVSELKVKSPLRMIGFTKSDIRIMSKYLKLPTWNKPSFSCLATRFVYGEAVTPVKLSMVDKAEQLLLDLGFRQVRVRIHNKMARIEIAPEEFDKLIAEEVRNQITKNFKEYGFDYVSMDLIGYRTGSMNEVLK